MQKAMSKPPKVLHIIYDLMRGGTEGQCARTAMACRRMGLDHRVAVFVRSGYFLGAVEAACGPVYEIGIRKFFSLHTLREIWRLKSYICREGFDIVHAWDMDACIFGALAARWADVPYITSRRNLAEVMPAYKRNILRFSDTGASAVVVNANAVRDHFVACGLDPEKVHVIPNMLDLDDFNRAAEAEDGLPDGRIAGMVCRLEPEKDAGTFIRAAVPLLVEFPDVKFVVIGDGSKRQELQRQASAAGVDHAFIFMGERTDVPALISKFQIGVLTPLKNEGLSNSILEYMAAGIPVVATDCGGNAELLGQGAAGLIVPIGDDAALASALSQLLNHPDEARGLGLRGRQLVANKHSVEAICKQFLDLYDKVSENLRHSS